MPLVWVSPGERGGGDGRQFLNFEFVHPDSAGKNNPKAYLEKAIFDILSNSKRKRSFRL